MNRRTFLQLGASAAVAATLAACAPRAGRSAAATEFDAAGFTAARRYQQTRFGRIAYVEQGSGPAALFLHGFPLNSFQWRGALPRLAPLRRCIAPDFLGLGYSEVATGQSVAPAAQAEMLAELLDRLGVDSIDLVANDSGGAVAQLFLIRYPQRVRSLLLTNCDVETDSPPPAVVPVIEAARAGRFADDTFHPQLADKQFARSAEGIGGLCYTYPQNPDDETIDYYFTPLVASPQRSALTNAYAAALDPNPLAGVAASLRGCSQPARILWGEGDTIFQQASADYLHQLLPGSRGIRRVPAAKLFFPEEFPDLIAEEARRLWTAVG